MKSASVVLFFFQKPNLIFLFFLTGMGRQLSIRATVRTSLRRCADFLPKVEGISRGVSQSPAAVPWEGSPSCNAIGLPSAHVWRGRPIVVSWGMQLLISSILSPAIQWIRMSSVSFTLMYAPIRAQHRAEGGF